jgi:hypothetical protein
MLFLSKIKNFNELIINDYNVFIKSIYEPIEWND